MSRINLFRKTFRIAIALLFGHSVALADNTRYVDTFDGDGIGTNAGDGGGMVTIDSFALAYTETADGLAAPPTSTGGHYGAAHTENTFAIPLGFSLEVTYSVVSANTSTLADSATFGLAPAIDPTSLLTGLFIQDKDMPGGLGVSLTIRDDGDEIKQGLNELSSDGAVSTLSNGQEIKDATEQTCIITVDANGNYTFSIDGAEPSTGTTSLDLDQAYYFAVYTQRNADFLIKSVSFIPYTEDDIVAGFSTDLITPDFASPAQPYSTSLASYAVGNELVFSIEPSDSWLTITNDGEISGTPSTSNLGLNTYQVSIVDNQNNTATTTLNLKVVDGYYDAFNDGDLATNPNTGGGLEAIYSSSYTLAPTEADGLISFAKGEGSNSGAQMVALFSENTFSIDEGFTLKATYDLGQIVHAASYTASFGLAELNAPENTTGLFKQAAINNALGVNMTYREGLVAQGLSLNTLTNTTEVGEFVTIDNTQAISAGLNLTLELSVYTDRTYSYSIDGQEASTGTLPDDFDMTKLYHLAIYTQHVDTDFQIKDLFFDNTDIVPDYPDASFTTDPIELSEAYEGQAFSESIAQYAVGEELTFSLLSTDSWLSMSSEGTLSGTPSASHIGDHSIEIQVTDINSITDTATVNITVYEALAIPDMEQYVDNFDGDGLETNTGDGGGLLLHKINTRPFTWEDTGSLISSDNNAGSYFASVYTENAFEVKNGFSLTVDYDIALVEADGKAYTLAFGIIETPTNYDSGNFTDPTSTQNCFSINLTDCYTQGVSIIKEDGSQTFLTDGEGIAAASNQTITVEVDADGVFTCNINGVITTGTTDFDLSKNYHFSVYEQYHTGIEIHRVAFEPVKDITEINEFSMAVSASGDSAEFSWYGQKNGIYAVQFRDNLVIGGTQAWETISETYAGNNETISFTIDIATEEAPIGFYRVILID